MSHNRSLFLVGALGISLAIALYVYREVQGNVAVSWAQGIAAAGVLTIGAIVLYLLPRGRWLFASLLLILAIFFSLGGFWFSYPAWGISDWDYYFSLHHTIRETVLTHQVFPLWNPYTCGGTAALGDPEFSLLTPTFALELIFGVERGLRLAIYLATITGGLGMLALGKRVGLSVYAALLGALVFALGSVNLLEIVEGHPNVFAAGWIPWIFWAWLGAYRASTKSETRNPKQVQNSKIRRFWDFGFWSLVLVSNLRFGIWNLLAGLFLALTFYQGGIYLLMYTTLAFLVLPWLTRRPLQAYLTTLYAGIWSVGLAAFKLFPVLWWLRQFQDNVYAGSTYTLQNLPAILFGRYLHGAEVIYNQGSGWHEYGAYIGITAGVLALLALLRLRDSRAVRGLVVAVVLALVLSSSGPLLKPFFDHLPFFPRSNISRFILFAVLPLALLAGFGLDYLRQRFRRVAPLLGIAAIGLASAELATLAYALSLQAFVLPPVVPPVPAAPAPIAYIAHTYQTRPRHGSDDYSRSYAAALAGYGTLNYCTPLTPPIRIRTIHDEVDNDIISLGSRQATFRLQEWTPNHAVVEVKTLEQSEVVLNTNYAKGWKVNARDAKEVAGRVGTLVPPGNYILHFRYTSPGVRLGGVVSLLTLVAFAVVLVSAAARKKSN